MTIRVPAIAKGARSPATPKAAAVQMVKHRKKVPMNSVIILAFISLLSDMEQIQPRTSINVGSASRRRSSG